MMWCQRGEGRRRRLACPVVRVFAAREAEAGMVHWCIFAMHAPCVANQSRPIMPFSNKVVAPCFCRDVPKRMFLKKAYVFIRMLHT
jgi:hypothetical protein